MICSVSSVVQKRHWKKADAVITFIGLPDGAVFGNYTDYTGKLHVNESLHIDYNFYRPQKNGDYVKILYDLESQKVTGYNDLLKDIVTSTSIFIVSCISILILMRRKSKL